jgi:hypothetical protein
MAVIVKLLSKFDDSGIRKAKSSFGGLTKTLGALGVGLSLKAMTTGLLDAAKAASIDAKSMQLLNNQLVRNANATDKQVAANNKFIDSLALQVGIADDQLRPAQARLARATGSTAKSQELLKLALDASAVSGRPLESVSTALAKAFNGNTTSLKRMFPELSKSKDIIGDLTKAVKGAAEEQADPFARMNVAFGELQEKLGAVILPYILDFIDTMMKPGGAIDQVGKFLEDVSNPKTEAGQMFLQVKDAVEQTVDAVKTFFGFFGDGDAVKGFANIASSLVQALPALIALKGIMMLASGGKAIASLVTAMSIIAGKNTTGVPPVVSGLATNPLVIAAASSQVATLAASTEAERVTNIEAAKKGMQFNIVAATFTGSMALPRLTNGYPGDILGLKGNRPTTVNINVQGADPKATVDALGKYLKQNGSLPFNVTNPPTRKIG